MDLKFEIKKPGNIKDKEVLEQLPQDIVEKLGEFTNSGYDLIFSRRELFYENGVVEYCPYRNQCSVRLGTPEELGLQVIELPEPTE